MESLRGDVTLLDTPRAQVSTSVDLPLSFAGKKVLACAAEEAERLRHRQIGATHLLLALLGDPVTSLVLDAHGVHRDHVLEHAKTLTDLEINDLEHARVVLLVRTLPPQLLPEAEQLLQSLLLKSQTEDQADHSSSSNFTLQTTRSFQDGAVKVTDTVTSGAKAGTVDYSVTVQAFGHHRSWRTTFAKASEASQTED